MTLSRPAPAPWARVRLLAGDSPSRQWEVSSSDAEARVSLGSGASMSWRIEAAGVLPHHVELFWNSRELWVGNAAGDYSVRVDGEPIREWLKIQGRARIEFANAVLEVETGLSPPTSAGGGTFDASTVHLKLDAPEIQWNDERTVIEDDPPKMKAPPRGVFIEATQMLPAEHAASTPSYTEEATKIHDVGRPSMSSPVRVDEITLTKPIGTGAQPAAIATEEPSPIPNDQPFALPPPPEQEPALRALQQLTQRFSALNAQPNQALPLRTWGLIAAVVIMIGVAVTTTVRKRRQAEAEAAALAAEAAAQRAAPVPTAAPSTSAIHATPSMAGAASAELIKQAATALFAGHRNEALRLYREIAAREPDNESYRVIVAVLERQTRPCSQTAGVLPCTP